MRTQGFADCAFCRPAVTGVLVELRVVAEATEAILAGGCLVGNFDYTVGLCDRKQLGAWVKCAVDLRRMGPIPRSVHTHAARSTAQRDRRGLGPARGTASGGRWEREHEQSVA